MTKDHHPDHDPKPHEPTAKGPQPAPVAQGPYDPQTGLPHEIDPVTGLPRRVDPLTGQLVYGEADERAAQLAQDRVADANRAAADALGKPDAGNPLREPVDIGKDDRGLDRDVRVDPADGQMKTFVSNNTGKTVED